MTVCRRIEAQTGLRAVTGKQFEWITMNYFMRKTGIPFNFGITVVLGFIVGTAIAAQTFYLFTIENIKQYGALKAMGAGNWSLMAHDPAAGVAGEHDRLWPGHRRAPRGSARSPRRPARGWRFTCRWEVFIGTGLAVGAISIFSSLLSMQRVMVVEPAVVFQG